MKEFEKKIAILRMLPDEVIINEFRLGEIPISLTVSAILVKHGLEDSISEESLKELNRIIQDTSITGQELYLAVKHLV